MITVAIVGRHAVALCVLCCCGEWGVSAHGVGDRVMWQWVVAALVVKVPKRHMLVQPERRKCRKGHSCGVNCSPAWGGASKGTW